MSVYVATWTACYCDSAMVRKGMQHRVAHFSVPLSAGGPNSNDFGTNRILHHTIGEPDFHQEIR